LTGEFTIAVHALVYLNHKREYVNSEALAVNVCTNPARIRKIMAKLKKAGLAVTKEGADGGYAFTLDPGAVDLRTVLEAVGDRAVPLAWRSGDPCAECLVSSGMAGIMDGITDEMDEACREKLAAITIKDINEKIFGEKG